MAKRHMTEVERIEGKRADFIVYYTRNGKRFRDAMWATDADDCRQKFLAFCKELGWADVSVSEIVPTVEH